MRGRGTLWAAMMLTTLAPPLKAQVTGVAEDPGAESRPAWLAVWSPLRPLADLSRIAPGAGFDAMTLPLGIAHRVGLFWTGGNPAGLARELDEGFSTFEVGSFRQSGDYRRPLDPGQKSSMRVGALGWSPLEGSGAGIGRVVVDRSTVEGPAVSNVLSPYSSSPLVVFDTVGAAKSWTAARLEGAGAWALGRLALGLSLGVEVQSSSTEAAPAPVSTRTSLPGAVVGASWTLLDGALSLGAQARWRRSTHSLSVYSLAAASRVYEISGFVDPVAHDLVSTLIRRRIDGEAIAVGGGAAGRFAGMRWALSGEAQFDEAFRYEGSTATSRKDRWKADGWSMAGALMGTAASTDFQLDVSGARVDGAYTIPDMEEEAFLSEESRWRASLDLRRSWKVWWGGIRVAVDRDHQMSRDRVVGAERDLLTWISSGVVEVGRSLSARLSASVGAGVLAYVPNGTLPEPTALGPVYQRWIGPELSYHGSKSTVVVASGRVSWAPAGDYGLFLIGSFSRLAPSAGRIPLPGRADGNRQHLSIRFGVQRSGL